MGKLFSKISADATIGQSNKGRDSHGFGAEVAVETARTGIKDESTNLFNFGGGGGSSVPGILMVTGICVAIAFTCLGLWFITCCFCRTLCAKNVPF